MSSSATPPACPNAGVPRERSRLSPCVFYGVVNLHIIDGAAGRTASDQVDKAIVHHSGNGAIDRNRQVFAARPLANTGLVYVHVGDGTLGTVAIDHEATHEYDLAAFRSGRGGIHAANHSWHGVSFEPFATVQMQDINLAGDVVPGFMRADPHH